ncbi:PEP-CTERM sorting domain-containing protein [Candidatus Nitrospira bockiana]
MNAEIRKMGLERRELTARTATAAWILALTLAVIPTTGRAALVNLGPGSFSPLASVIEFDEVALGTVNPVYNFVGVPDLGNVTVSFGGHFIGQAAGGGFPNTLIDTTPTGPLALDPLAPVTQTVNDGAPGATSPVLSGTPTFNGPISILFSQPVAGVGLKGGFFDAVGATTIEAFDANGVSLGTITNSQTGFEFYGLAILGGGSAISGVSFYITGNEPAGFQIDNVTFGSERVIIPSVPEPASLLLMATGLAGLAFFALKRKVNS